MLDTIVLTYLSKLFCSFGFQSYIHSDRGLGLCQRSWEDFFKGKEELLVGPLRTSHEKTVKWWSWTELSWGQLSLKIKIYQRINGKLYNLTVCSIRSCERMFFRLKISFSGISVLLWLMITGKVLMRSYVQNKCEHNVLKVELLYNVIWEEP